jgi:hypothetical protein
MLPLTGDGSASARGLIPASRAPPARIVRSGRGDRRRARRRSRCSAVFSRRRRSRVGSGAIAGSAWNVATRLPARRGLARPGGCRGRNRGHRGEGAWRRQPVLPTGVTPGSETRDFVRNASDPTWRRRVCRVAHAPGAQYDWTSVGAAALSYCAGFQRPIPGQPHRDPFPAAVQPTTAARLPPTQTPTATPTRTRTRTPTNTRQPNPAPPRARNPRATR